MSDPEALLEAAETAAAELDGVETVEIAGRTEWQRDGLAFAILDGPRIVIRVGAVIAAAAIRTPDTTAAERGGDWIAFEPPVLDDHALDRLEAWLAAAWRRALA